MIAEELADVCARAGAVVSGSIEWKRPVWTVEIAGQRAVLHRHAVHRPFDDVLWELESLDLLADRFPSVPRPVRAFDDGLPVLAAHGAVWTLQELLPGTAAGWDYAELAQVGAFLARFHQATRGLELGPRPATPVPSADLASADHGDDLDRRLGADAVWFRGLRERTCERLERAGVFGGPCGPIHGDLTVFNLLVTDARPSGLVDFALSTRDVQVLDLAYACWSWSRRSFEARELDVERLVQLVHGYTGEEPLSAPSHWLPDAILLRAFQLIARWLPRRPEQDLTPTITRLRFLDDQRDTIGRALEE